MTRHLFGERRQLSQTFGKLEENETYPKQIFMDSVFFFSFRSENYFEIGIPSDFTHNCLIVCHANNIQNIGDRWKKAYLVAAFSSYWEWKIAQKHWKNRLYSFWRDANWTVKQAMKNDFIDAKIVCLFIFEE